MRTLLALLLAFAPVAVQADSAHWLFINYHDYQDIDVRCPVNAACSVDFAAGEVEGKFTLSDGVHWSVHFNYIADSTGRPVPQLIAEPNSRTTANVIFGAKNTHREYHIALRPAQDDEPTYTVFKYPAPPAPPDQRQQSHAHAQVAYVSMSLEQRMVRAMDHACRYPGAAFSADPDTDKNGNIDPVLASIRPSEICGDRNHTYFTLPMTWSNPSDLPVISLLTPSGLVHVIPHYFENERLFVVDSTANIAIAITYGKRDVQMNVQRLPNAR